MFVWILDGLKLNGCVDGFKVLYSLTDLELNGLRGASEIVATGEGGGRHGHGDSSSPTTTTTQLFGQLTQRILPELEYPSNYAYHHRFFALLLRL